MTLDLFYWNLSKIQNVAIILNYSIVINHLI